MTDEVQATAWQDSSLPRAIVRALDPPKSLSQLAGELQATDARVLWYLRKLAATGRVEEANGRWERSATPKYGFHWLLTPTDLHPLDDE